MSNSIDTSLSNKKIYKKFVLPMIISQIVMGIVQLGDRIIGSVYIGTVTLQIVSNVFPVLMIGMAFGFMMMTGLGVESNYLVGRKEKRKAESMVSFALIFQLIISVIIGIVLFILAEPIVDFLIGGGDASIKEGAIDYLKILVIVYPFLSTGFTLSSVILADGNPNYNMFGMILFSLANLVLNILLVVMLGWGVEGLAYGTLLSGVIFCIYNASYFVFKLNKNFKIKKPKVDFKSLGRIMYNGSSDFVVIGAVSIMMISINRIIQDNMSVEFFLAYSVLTMITTLYATVGEGAIYGIVPVISKLLGEKNINKIKSMASYSYIYSFILSVLLYLMLFPLVKTVGSFLITNDGTIPESIFNIFKEDVLTTTVKLYMTLGIVQILAINSTFTSGFLSAVKQPLMSLIVSIIKPVIFIPIFTIVFVKQYGDNGLIYGVLLSELLYIPISIVALNLYFKKIKKKGI